MTESGEVSMSKRTLLPPDFPDLPDAKQAEIIKSIQAGLQMSRTWIELTHGIEKEKGLIMQNEAQIEEIDEALTTNRDRRDKPFPVHRRKHMEGRKIVHQSSIARSNHLIEQYQMELAFYETLMNGKE